MELLLDEETESPVVIEKHDGTIDAIKKGIWVYFVLIILEGAFRKWFLPGLATPFLVIRDPIAIWLIYMGLKRNLFPSTIYLSGTVAIGVLGVFTAIFVGHGNVWVALYGGRILFLQFPLIFLIGRVFDRADILKMGKAIIYISIPMAILITMQFYSPQSAWVNRGIAGDLAGAGFSGIGDYKRPPGTFSFITGVIQFFGLLAPFVFYYWFNIKDIRKWVLLAASGALLIAIPFSISRSLLFEVCLTAGFAIMASVRKPGNFKMIMLAGLVVLIAFGILSQTHFFATATGAFSERFTTANQTEGGLVKGVIGDRFFGGLLSALFTTTNQPFWGFGIGMGTNVGSMLLTGDTTFLIAEAEWARIIGELGPVLGLLVISLRVGLTFKIAKACYMRFKMGDLLPWLLLSFAFIILAQGQWAQPTALGFAVMIGGLTIASLKGPEVAE